MRLHRLAYGSGIGIEIAGEDLRVAVARTRPQGAALSGATTIHGFRNRPPGEWGAEYRRLLKRHGASHLAAVVVLPREEVVVRLMELRGVPNRDLDAAVRLNLDSLHPYPAEEAAHCWARIGGRGGVLVGVIRRTVLERYIRLFAEAGVPVACFTISGAVLYSAIRLQRQQPAGGFVALVRTGAGPEAYGESPSRPMFSALLPGAPERACALAASELRLDAEAQQVYIEDLLPHPEGASIGLDVLPYAAALAGASRRSPLRLNLLPPEHRTAPARLRFVLTAALALVALTSLATLAWLGSVEDRRYLAKLTAEIKTRENQLSATAELDRSIERVRGRILSIAEFRRRSQADLDAISRLTAIIEPPGWLNALDIGRDSITMTGQSEEAPGLLRALDASGVFRESAFTMPLAREESRYVFRIRADRAAPVVDATFAGTPAFLANTGRANSIAAAETLLRSLRRRAASFPVKEKTLARLSADLAELERGLFDAETVAQAQAQLWGVLRRVNQAQPSPVEFGAIELDRHASGKTLKDYGEIEITAPFSCRIGDLASLLEGLSRQPELIAASQISIAAADARQKTVAVRLTVSAMIPARLARS